jgi:superfamily II DNA or RNA helicase
MLRAWPNDLPLYTWQSAMWEMYLKHPHPDFLIVATPGAGKTLAALWIAHNLLDAGKIDRIVVVCPTDNLREQWKTAATEVGIHLDSEWDATIGETADFHGVIATYAQLALRATTLRRLCRRKTLYIFDEIHHAGEQRAWGDSVKESAELATYRLHLSGTPFRGDNRRIPFITYIDGRSRADYSYTYADALNDGVCRPIVFASYEGETEWFSKDRVIVSTFAEDLPEDLQRQRLRFALDPRGKWLPQVLDEANDRLMDIRANDQANAGGLVLASSTEAAEAIADMLQKRTGIRPPVVTIDNPDAQKDIKKFNAGRDPWIVAIKMISEGTDIKRLRVGVYATTTTSLLFFRQAVGRFIRVINPEDNEVAYLFLPMDPVLMDLAYTIKQEIDHALQDEVIGDDWRERTGTITQESLAYFIAANAARVDQIVLDGRAIDPFYLERARELISKLGGFRLAVEVVARVIEAYDPHGAPPAPAATPQVEMPRADQRRKARNRVHTLVSTLAGILKRKHGGEFNDICISLYVELSKRDGAIAKTALIEQQQARAQYLEQRIKEESQRG